MLTISAKPIGSLRIAQHHNVAIVVSDFNAEITNKLLQATTQRLISLGASMQQLKIVHVPGAIEIPLATQLLAQSNKYQAIICLGAVIRGDTSHYEYVCQQVSQGCQQVMLKFNLPVIFGVLTTESYQQAIQRAGVEHNAGIAAADAAAAMLQVVASLIN
jgi:6,7-dimethyl-8-ribityllumazine synthase